MKEKKITIQELKQIIKNYERDKINIEKKINKYNEKYTLEQLYLKNDLNVIIDYINQLKYNYKYYRHIPIIKLENKRVMFSEKIIIYNIPNTKEEFYLDSIRFKNRIQQFEQLFNNIIIPKYNSIQSLIV